MANQLSSAGLLYLYINGYEEDGIVYLQQIDSYKYIDDGLYRKIMESAELADQNDNTVHIFAVVGSNEKTDAIYSVVKKGLESNFQRILSNKNISIDTCKLDRVGNIFYRCVQEFYCMQPSHFPKEIYHTYGNIVFAGICCNHVNNENGDFIAEHVVSLWMEREKPEVCGKQIMTYSFYMRSFVGRKVIGAIPNIETGDWRLAFEGGIQFNTNASVTYTKETFNPNDLGSFCAANIQTILLDPVYAYGKWLRPNDIREEWQKLFLFLCAISDIDWNIYDFHETFESFLAFLEQNICVTTRAPAMITKEKYYGILLKYIEDFRGFLKGEDEPVISKDLLQTLNTRYVYLPYLWGFVKPTIPKNQFSCTKLKNMTEIALSEKDVYKKGILWEDVAAYVINNITGWKITGRRIKTEAQEIDISIANVSLDDELWQLGAYILVECKNWNDHVDIHQIRNIAHISNMKGNKTALLFAANGITVDAQDEIYRLVDNDISIIFITANELESLNSAEECKALILKKWKELQNSPYNF